MNTNYDGLNARERISRIHLDLMQDPEFSRIGPVTQIGEVHIAGPEKPTACTNGLDTWYNEQWTLSLNRGQLRYVVAHEQLHKLLMHCTLYNAAFKKHPQEAAQAVDYVVNLVVEDMDGKRSFVERPTDFPPLIDEKYRDWSCMEVLQDLINNGDDGTGGGGKGTGKGGTAPPPPMDEHMQREPGDGDAEKAKEEEQMLEDAHAQGEITSARLRGTNAGGASLKGFEKTTTEWRDPLRQFMVEAMEGDEMSRWCPPNKLFRPLGIMLPSHFAEAVGGLVVACDTSGSMQPYYARVFGEIGRVAEQVQPMWIIVIWWDSKVQSVQKFVPADYLTLATRLKAKGGGGTTVSCVAEYMKEAKLQPKATIILTDGEIETQYECPPGPLLWGVVGGARFKPLKGKLLRIRKESL
jgi:predicted metal-dependent peptidase